MRSTRSKNQKRKRGSKSRRRLRQRGGATWKRWKDEKDTWYTNDAGETAWTVPEGSTVIDGTTGKQLHKRAVQTEIQLQKSAEPTGPVQTVVGRGANFARRIAAGLKSRVLAAVKSHKPFDQNVALPVLRNNGVTYKLVKFSGNDYMWEIKGWNSSEPEKSFLVPTGWILQMPAKGEDPCFLIPISEWAVEFDLSEEEDPLLNGGFYNKKDLADQMAGIYPIFRQTPIANFDVYLFDKRKTSDEDGDWEDGRGNNYYINRYALRLPFSYWGTHLPVPESMPEEQAKKIRKQAEEAAKFFAITGNYLVRYRNNDGRLTFTYGGNKVKTIDIDPSWKVRAEVKEDGSISFIPP